MKKNKSASSLYQIILFTALCGITQSTLSSNYLSTPPFIGTPGVGAGPTSIAYSPNGQWAAVVNSGATPATVSVYSVNNLTGVLTPVTGSPFATPGDEPQTIAYSPDSKWAALTDSDENLLTIYSVNQTTGALTQTSNITVAGGADDVQYSPTINGNTYYLAVTSATLSVYSQTGGVPTPIDSHAANQSTSVAYSPNGAYAAVANNGDNTVNLYTVEATGMNAGKFTPANTYTFSEFAPLSVAFSPNNNFFAVTGTDNHGNGFVYIFSVSSTTAVGSYSTGSFPVWVTYSPDGTHLVTANSGANNVSAFSVTPSTGVLTPVTGSPFSTVGHDPQAIAYSYSGAFLATANESTNNVSVFQVNSVTPTSSGLDPFVTRLIQKYGANGLG